jgi:hypothetical protein
MLLTRHGVLLAQTTHYRDRVLKDLSVVEFLERLVIALEKSPVGFSVHAYTVVDFH